MVQKLENRDIYTPLDAPQVQGNCDLAIKHRCEVGEVLQGLKTFSNSSDVDQHSGKSVQDLWVPVLNMRGQPLMPTKPAKARHLLEQGKARVVSRKPFTIQLNYATGETKQPIKLGIDPGYEKTGISIISPQAELFSDEITLRTDIPKKLQDRAMYRRNRRNRLWHRPSRFDNRKKEKGWLAPSIQHKLDTHIRIIKKLKTLFPIIETTVEVAKFDIQKIKNPDIEGAEYQNGEQTGFWNTREYVLYRDNHTCQHCKGKKKDPILQVHHINGKKEGATNRPEELLTVCKTCHEQHHKGIDIIPKKKIKNFKPEAFMTIVRWKIVNILNCKHTYGHITKSNRIKLGLPKTHINDAFVIARGTTQKRCKPYISKPVRRNNRSLQKNRKGFKPSIRRKRYNFQPNDLVMYNNREYRVKGVHSYGKSIVLIDQLMNKIDVSTKKVRLICYGKGILV